MNNAWPTVPPPVNEPVHAYGPGSPEKAALKAELERQAGTQEEIPLVIGGKRITTGKLGTAVMPHDHGHVLATYHEAGPEEIRKAIEVSLEAHRAWSTTPWNARAAVFLRAAQLLAGPWRARLNAATMLNQSKTCHQAEIDSACELIDFWRFNCAFAAELYEQQPASPTGVWNSLELRPLEGFTLAVTPFNFTAIAGNLPTAPALMGNVALWKPSPSAVHSNYQLMLLLEEAGLPPGVVNFVPGPAEAIVDQALAHRDFAGLHYTGSTAVFRGLWKKIGDRIDGYRNYPRIVGETGGKDFIVAHESADEATLTTAIVRGAFEYQGQKCSAASRLYVPQSLWGRIREPLLETVRELRMGDVRDFRNFMSAVIHERAFDTHAAAIAEARASNVAEVLVGGETDKSQGYFVRPTIIQAEVPAYRTMREELFGPIATVFVYPDGEFEKTLDLVDGTSDYALTGAVFARDRAAVELASARLRFAAGNFYINDKPTGAVVGNQPFGGGRASGTDDKAGSPLNLQRWVQPRTIKETFSAPTDHRYPFLTEE